MLENLIFKKSKISGVALNGSISADWLFRVANFGFNYLRHFSKQPQIYNLMVLKGVMDKKPKKSDNGKYAILSQPWNLTFFEDEIF